MEFNILWDLRGDNSHTGATRCSQAHGKISPPAPATRDSPGPIPQPQPPGSSLGKLGSLQDHKLLPELLCKPNLLPGGAGTAPIPPALLTIESVISKTSAPAAW